MDRFHNEIQLCDGSPKDKSGEKEKTDEIENINGREMDPSQEENQHSVPNINGSPKDKSGEKKTTVEIEKLKNRTRAFTGAFVGMVSPVLLAIVLKKTNLKGVGKYQGTTRMLERLVEVLVPLFPYLAAVTLVVGMMPFLFAMVSEACASNLPNSVTFTTERFQGLSKILVFVSSILLMIHGCGVLAFIHKNAWFSTLVVSECFGVALIVILWHFCSCRWWWRSNGSADNNNNVRDNKEYHSKLEHWLEFSSGITAMMFLVLGSVVLEGLLRSTQLSQPLAAVPSEAPLAAVPSEAPTTKEPGTHLAATLVVSFLTGAFGALLMNVWTIPLVVPQDETLPTSSTTAGGSGDAGRHTSNLDPSGDAGGWIYKFALYSNIVLGILAVVVVFLITWEGLQHVAWLIFYPPFMLLMVLRIRCVDGDNEEDNTEETKPAPLELTKVAFTGFLAVAVPGITSASPGAANKVFVFCTAATVVLGLLWRLLTHVNAPSSSAVRKAGNHSSFLALAFLLIAGISFGVMASC